MGEFGKFDFWKMKVKQYLQYKAFAAQLCQLAMSFYIGFLNLGQWNNFFLENCIHGIITFSDSSGFILGLLGIKYWQEFIFWFYRIW